VDTISNEKRLLELEIQCPKSENRQELLCIEDICGKLPDDCVFIDYYCHPESTEGPKYLGDMRYSVFVLYKKDTKAVIKRLPCINAFELRKRIAYFTAAIDTSEDNALAPFIARSAKAYLYNVLINPLKQYIGKDVTKLIISPDFDICKLPLSVLGEGKMYLLDRYKILYVDSARDIHEDNLVETLNKTSLVIGNPAFTIDKENIVPIPVEKLNSGALPLSKVEAMLVAEKLDTQPILLRDATKRILENTNADVIHIATHGILLDVENDGDEFIVDPFRRSCLFFSGINDWLRTGVIDSRYGNGILTAEEVYLSDMKSPELVALSACFSASGEQNIGGGVIGLRTAFKANGAKNMLLSIWEADDFSSAVLIDRFYDNLSMMPVAEALRNAQLYVRDITISELEQKMWFDESRLRRIGYSAESLRELSRKDAKTKPFEHPKYWGGYIIIE